MGCDIDYPRKTMEYVQPDDMTGLLTGKRPLQLVEEVRSSYSRRADIHVQKIGSPVTFCGKELGGDWVVRPWAIFLCGACAEKLNIKTEKW